jgi:phospholipid/cholesterol/gamma-HCH transport system substrate-binding protein
MSGRAMLQIRRYGRSFAILIALIVLGVATGFYILLQQRLPNPLQTFYEVKGAFPTAAAVVPGLGEPVLVSGVHIGEITGTYVKDGQGIIDMEIQPGKLPHVFNDAHATLEPNTPLDDMEVDIQPGSPSAGVLRHGGEIPVSQTVSPTQLDQLLDSLDSDTRGWLVSLITDLNGGVQGRGRDIRALLGALAPTAEQTRQISDLLAQRRTELQSIVHNLGTLTAAAASKDRQIGEVVDAGQTTLQALSSQDTALRAAVAQLPATLQVTARTLNDVVPFSQQLTPTVHSLLPIVHHLPSTLRDLTTALKGIALLPLSQIRRFERATVPLASQLAPITGLLTQAVPPLTDSFKVLEYVTNELAYNPGAGNPGFLYWLAWFAHNADSFFSSSDANGPAWRSLLIADCQSLSSLSPSLRELLDLVLGSPFGCTGQ